MNTLLKNSKTLIKYSLTIMASAVLLGLIFLFTFGFNASTEFGGAYEITIFSFDSTQNQKYIDTTSEVLDSYGYKAVEVIKEEHSDSDAITIRYKSTSATNAAKIETELTETLSLNENLISVQSLTDSTQVKTTIKLLITLGVMLVALFIYGWLRHDWKFAVALVSILALSIILPLSTMLFTRLELSLATLGAVIIGGLLTTVLYMAIYAKVKSITKLQDRPQSFLANYSALIESLKIKAIIPLAMILLVNIALIFTFVRGLVMVGLAGVMLMVENAFLLIIFTPALQILLNKEKN